MQRIDSDGAVRNVEFAEQFLRGRNFIGLLIDVDMHQDQAEFGIEGMQQLGWFAVSEIVETSTEHLSIERNGALLGATRTVQKTRSVAAEYLLEVLRIKALEDVANGGVGWRALPLQTEGGVQSAAMHGDERFDRAI